VKCAWCREETPTRWDARLWRKGDKDVDEFTLPLCHGCRSAWCDETHRNGYQFRIDLVDDDAPKEGYFG